MGKRFLLNGSCLLLSLSFVDASPLYAASACGMGGGTCYGSVGGNTCQCILPTYSVIPSVAESKGLRLNANVANALTINYPALGPLFISNASTRDLFVPQATENEFFSFLQASLNGVSIIPAVPSSSYTAKPTFNCGGVSPSERTVNVPYDQNSGANGNPIVLNGFTKMTADAATTFSQTVTVGKTTPGGPLDFTSGSGSDIFIESQAVTVRSGPKPATIVPDTSSVPAQKTALTNQILTLSTAIKSGKYPAATLAQLTAQITTLQAQLAALNSPVQQTQTKLNQYVWNMASATVTKKLYKKSSDGKYTEVASCTPSSTPTPIPTPIPPVPTPTGAPAKCGSSVTEPPTASALCAAGSSLADSVRFVKCASFESYYEWSCRNDSSGETTGCRTARTVHASCGPYGHNPYYYPKSTPSDAAGLCSIGTPTAVSEGSGSWVWYCNNVVNGIDYSTICSTGANHSIEPACGTANGQTYESVYTWSSHDGYLTSKVVSLPDNSELCATGSKTDLSPRAVYASSKQIINTWCCVGTSFVGELGFGTVLHGCYFVPKTTNIYLAP